MHRLLSLPKTANMVLQRLFSVELADSIYVGWVARCIFGDGEHDGVAIDLSRAGEDEPRLDLCEPAMHRKSVEDELGTALVDVEAFVAMLGAPCYAGYSCEVDYANNVLSERFIEGSGVADVALDEMEEVMVDGIRIEDVPKLILVKGDVEDGDGCGGSEKPMDQLLA